MVASGSVVLTQKSARRWYCPCTVSRSGSPPRSIQSWRWLLAWVNSSWRASSREEGRWRTGEGSRDLLSSSNGRDDGEFISEEGASFSASSFSLASSEKRDAR